MYSIQRSVVQAAVKFVTSAAVNAKKKKLVWSLCVGLNVKTSCQVGNRRSLMFAARERCFFQISKFSTYGEIWQLIQHWLIIIVGYSYIKNNHLHVQKERHACCTFLADDFEIKQSVLRRCFVSFQCFLISSSHFWHVSNVANYVSK